MIGLDEMRTGYVIGVCIALSIAGCGSKPAAAPEDDAEREPAGETGARQASADAAPVSPTRRKNPTKLAPPLKPAPEEVASIGREVVEALRANDVDGLNEVHIKYETYEKHDVLAGLGIEDRLIEKLGPGFFWADMSGDSAEVREALLDTYGGKSVEFVKLEYGEHEDNEHLELWRDLVLTLRVEGEEPKPVAALGEIVREKATGEYWLLRYKTRKLPPREGDKSVAEGLPPERAAAGPQPG